MPNYAFEIENTYTFTSLAPAILGVSFDNVKLQSILNFDQASKIENVSVKYANILPALPVTTPVDPELSRFYLFKSLESGIEVLLSEWWIDNSSVVLTTTVNFQVLFTGADINDIASIQTLLNGAGYYNFEIKEV